MSCSPAPIDPRSTVRILSLLLALWALAAPGAPAGACEGKPKPPVCAKTLVLAQAAPPTLLLPGGGTFSVPVTVYFQVLSFPAGGAGVCPGGPFAVDVSVTVTCMPTADGGGSALGVPVVNGFNDLSVPVTLPAGPPRMCTVTGTAVTTLSDGMTLSAASNSMLCVAAPAPGNPGLPRLGLALAKGDPIARVHPGDPSSHVYRLTNNDPVATFTGTLGVEMANSSRLPGMGGPTSPISGVYSVSDPSVGDHFPIGLSENLIGGCLPLPPNPLAPAVPMLSEPIVLLPGESRDVEIIARPWGMCADGSCGRAKVTADGSFSDASLAKACSGFVTAADVLTPPTFSWPDGGSAGRFQPPPDPMMGRLRVQGLPLPPLPVELDLITRPPVLAIDGGAPLPLTPQFLSGMFNSEHGRTRVRFQNSNLFDIDSFFDVFYRVDLQPIPGSGPMIQTEMVSMSLVGGAPSGFQDVGPFGVGNLGIHLLGDPAFAAFAQVTYQVSGVAVDDTGAFHELIFTNVQMRPTADRQGFEVMLRGMVAPGPGDHIVDLRLFGDPRLFFSEIAVPAIFVDGFESGDTSAWSVTVP